MIFEEVLVSLLLKHLLSFPVDGVHCKYYLKITFLGSKIRVAKQIGSVGGIFSSI